MERLTFVTGGITMNQHIRLSLRDQLSVIFSTEAIGEGRLEPPANQNEESPSTGIVGAFLVYSRRPEDKGIFFGLRMEGLSEQELSMALRQAVQDCPCRMADLAACTCIRSNGDKAANAHILIRPGSTVVVAIKRIAVKIVEYLRDLYGLTVEIMQMPCTSAREARRLLGIATA